ncbi:MAG TPA: DUF4405 domain-containing protein [bacterium]|nr:DUF4405 domain-containing protein [bacterium]HPN42186.1 DUF4405 domain-containing protein [bacterium]
MEEKKVNKRVLTVFFMIFSGVLLPFSGIILHTQEGATGSLYFTAMGVHNLAALVFTIFSILHVKYNWKPITQYFRDKKTSLTGYRKELVISLASFFLLLLLILFHGIVQH